MKFKKIMGQILGLLMRSMNVPQSQWMYAICQAIKKRGQCLPRRVDIVIFLDLELINYK